LVTKKRARTFVTSSRIGVSANQTYSEATAVIELTFVTAFARQLWGKRCNCRSLRVESDTDARQRGELNTQKNSGALFLLEDFHKCDDDEPPMHFSSYSWLALLADVLGDGKPIALMNNSPQRAILVDALDSEFAIDPINALSRLGAMFGPERRVTALYRVRAMCMERWEDGGLQEGKKRPSDFVTTTIGYPLIITAEGGLLDGLI
jgi:hypothetical protein